jgi:hypothetical protein
VSVLPLAQSALGQEYRRFFAVQGNSPECWSHYIVEKDVSQYVAAYDSADCAVRHSTKSHLFVPRQILKDILRPAKFG